MSKNREHAVWSPSLVESADLALVASDQTSQPLIAESEGETRTEPEILVADDSPEARSAQKEYYKILRKQNVRYNRDKQRYELRYYANDNPQSARHIALYDIKTAHSEDDNRLKYPFAAFCYALLIMSVISLFHIVALPAIGLGSASCNGRDDLLAALCTESLSTFVVLGVGIGLVVAASRLAWVIDNNFVRMDADWRNAIAGFFAPDVYSKMMGVRLCMLKFRQFIKWRRFANFFIRLFAVSFVVILGPSIGVRLAMGLPETWELVFCLAYLLGLLGTLYWFRAQRRVHTEWRDPTVQLSVMIAELHQKHVDNRVQVGGGTKT